MSLSDSLSARLISTNEAGITGLWLSGEVNGDIKRCETACSVLSNGNIVVCKGIFTAFCILFIWS